MLLKPLFCNFLKLKTIDTFAQIIRGTFLIRRFVLEEYNQSAKYQNSITKDLLSKYKRLAASLV